MDRSEHAFQNPEKYREQMSVKFHDRSLGLKNQRQVSAAYLTINCVQEGMSQVPCIYLVSFVPLNSLMGF